MIAPISRYLRFVRLNKQLLFFGLLMTFGSSFGQSFFVGLFQMQLREAFDLTASAFGGAFSFVTLLSAAALPWTGRVIDQVRLRTFSAIVITVLAAAALAIALVPHFWMFVVALFFLRHFGQGLMSHTSSTAMGRYFSANRGKAVTLASTGYSLGEALFPAVIVTLIVLIGWRQSWVAFSAMLMVGVLPLCLWLVWREPQHEAAVESHPDDNEHSTPHPHTAKRDWTRAEVLRDPRFYILIPAMMAPAFILTGFFIHQGFLAQSKDWPIELVAAGFSAFALIKIVASLLTGPFADRFGFRPLMAFYMVPLAFSLLAISFIDANYGIFIYFTLAGISTGGAMTVGGLLWPELYGTKHLGAIRSLSVSLMVFATALAPVIFGWMIDAGLSASAIANISLIYSLIAIAMIGFFLWQEKQTP